MYLSSNQLHGHSFSYGRNGFEHEAISQLRKKLNVENDLFLLCMNEQFRMLI